MIFGILNPEKISREILQTCAPYLSDVATLHFIFNGIIHTYFW